MLKWRKEELEKDNSQEDKKKHIPMICTILCLEDTDVA